MASIPPDNVVLEEEIDENYEPTEEELVEYARWLGMSLPENKELLWIAREGLKAPLPDHWRPCRTEDDEIYYFNFETGESVWEHPCDEYYRNLYIEVVAKQGANYQYPGPESSSPAQLPPPFEQRNSRNSGPGILMSAVAARPASEQQPAESSPLVRGLMWKYPSPMSSFQPPPGLQPQRLDSSLQSHASMSGEQGNSGHSSFTGSPVTPRFGSNSSASTGSVPEAGVRGMVSALRAERSSGVQVKYQQPQDGRIIPDRLVSNWSAAIPGDTSVVMQPRQWEEASASVRAAVTEDEVKAIHLARQELDARVSHWIQEEERREIEQQRGQMKERVRAKILEEERSVLQQERVEMFERAVGAVQEEEKELLDSRQAEMIGQVERQIEKEIGKLVERRMQEIKEEVDKVMEVEKRNEREKRLKQEEEEERQQMQEGRAKRTISDLQNAIEDEKASHKTGRRLIMQNLIRNLQDEEDQLQETERREMLQRVANRIRTEELELLDEMKEGMVKRVKETMESFERILFEDSSRALLVRVKEKTEARRKEVEDNLERVLEHEIIAQQQAFLKEKRDEMLRIMRDSMESQEWREKMEKEIMRTAIEKFADELQVEHLQLRTMLREDMVRLVSEKLLQEGAKEIESVKQQQLTRMLQKVQTEEAIVWRTVLTDLLTGSGAVGHYSDFRDVEDMHATVSDGLFAEKSRNSSRHPSPDGSVSTHGEQTDGTEKPEQRGRGLGYQDREEIQEVYAGHLARKSHADLPRSSAIFSSADLEPDKERKERPREKSSTRFVTPKRAVSWEDLVTGTSPKELMYEMSDSNKTDPRDGELHAHPVMSSLKNQAIQDWEQNLVAKDDIVFEGEQLKSDWPMFKMFRRVTQNAGVMLRKSSFRSQPQSRTFWSCTGGCPRRKGRRAKRDMKIGDANQEHSLTRKSELMWEGSSKRSKMWQGRTPTPGMKTENLNQHFLKESARKLLEIDREEGHNFRKSFEEKKKKMQASKAWREGWTALQGGVGLAKNLEEEFKVKLGPSGSGSSNTSSRSTPKTLDSTVVDRGGKVVRSPVDEAIHEVKELIAARSHLYGIKIPLKLEWRKEEVSENAKVGSQLVTHGSTDGGSSCRVSVSKLGHRHAAPSSHTHSTVFCKHDLSGLSVTAPRSTKTDAVIPGYSSITYLNRRVMAGTLRPSLYATCRREKVKEHLEVFASGTGVVTGTMFAGTSSGRRKERDCEVGFKPVTYGEGDSSWVVGEGSGSLWSPQHSTYSRNQMHWVTFLPRQLQGIDVSTPDFVKSIPIEGREVKPSLSSISIRESHTKRMSSALGMAMGTGGGSADSLLFTRKARVPEYHDADGTPWMLVEGSQFPCSHRTWKNVGIFLGGREEREPVRAENSSQLVKIWSIKGRRCRMLVERREWRFPTSFYDYSRFWRKQPYWMALPHSKYEETDAVMPEYHSIRFSNQEVEFGKHEPSLSSLRRSESQTECISSALSMAIGSHRGSDGSVFLDTDIVDLALIEIPRGRQVDGSPEGLVHNWTVEMSTPLWLGEPEVQQVEVEDISNSILALHNEWQQEPIVKNEKIKQRRATVIVQKSQALAKSKERLGEEQDTTSTGHGELQPQGSDSGALSMTLRSPSSQGQEEPKAK